MSLLKLLATKLRNNNKQPLKIFVINCKKDVERKSLIEKQLMAYGLSYEFFPAIEHDNNKGFCDEINSKLPHCTNLTRAEIGCFASHYFLWQKCVTLNSPIVVLEDDLIIDKSFPHYLVHASNYIDKCRYIKLYGLKQERKISSVKTISEQIKLGYYQKGPSGAQGYIISANGAHAFLSGIRKINIPVDDYMYLYQIHYNLPYVLFPFCIKPNDNLSSTIGARGIAKRKISSKLLLEYQRIIDSIKRYLTLIRLKHKTKPEYFDKN